MEGASPCAVAAKPTNPAGENAVFESEWKRLQGVVWETLLPCLALSVEGAQPCSECCIMRPVEQSTFAAHFGQCRAAFRVSPALLCFPFTVAQHTALVGQSDRKGVAKWRSSIPFFELYL